MDSRDQILFNPAYQKRCTYKNESEGDEVGQNRIELLLLDLLKRKVLRSAVGFAFGHKETITRQDTFSRHIQMIFLIDHVQT